MVDNQHELIKDHRGLSHDDIDLINMIKEGWMAIAKTHFEEGFSAFVRAVAKPEGRF